MSGMNGNGLISANGMLKSSEGQLKSQNEELQFQTKPNGDILAIKPFPMRTMFSKMALNGTSDYFCALKGNEVHIRCANGNAIYVIIHIGKHDMQAALRLSSWSFPKGWRLENSKGEVVYA